MNISAYQKTQLFKGALGLVLPVVALVAIVGGVTSKNPTRTSVGAMGNSASIDVVIARANEKSGSQVNVELVTLRNDGYLVIKEVVNGKSTNTVGSVWLSAGEHRDITVKLNKEFNYEQGLVAELHNDNGDGKYEEASDTQIVGSWGGPVMMEFFIGAPHAGMEDGHSDENTH